MMARRTLDLIPFAVLAAALALRILDPAPIAHVRHLVFDSYQRLKPRIHDPALPVRIVDVDDDSLERLGQWPWPRTILARLVDRLARAGAASIVFDMVFAEADRSSPAPGAHDRTFAAAIGRAPVVTGFILIHKEGARLPRPKAAFAYGGGDPRPFVPAFSGAVTNLPELEARAAGNGALNWAAGRDQIVRRVPLVLRIGETLYPSLLAEALRVAQGAGTHIVKSAGASGEAAFGARTGITAVRVGRATVPTDANGQMLLHFTEPVPGRYLPAWRVLAADFDGTAVAGRVVFIGTSAAGLRDVRATPIEAAVPGVEVHAQALEQILAGAYLARPDFALGAELAYILLIGLAVILALPRVGAPWSAALGAGALALVVGASWYAYDRHGWMLDAVFPAIAVLFAYLSATVVVYMHTEAERRQVRGAFGRYMSPALVDELARHPERLALGGEMREMTLLFCDIRGFTSISERFDAERLTRFINRFLTPMTEIVLGTGGTIDKYMGDCIMAFWNAPMDDPEHARNACRAALGMVDRLADLDETWRREAEAAGDRHVGVRIGVGLNTGVCCVGNMGSEQRFDYSVLGDGVNLASRLESETKRFGVDIIIGEATRAAAPELAALDLGTVTVRGRTEPTRIFALLGDEAMAASTAFQALAARHEELVTAVQSRRWRASRASLDACRGLADQRLAALYDGFGEAIRSGRRADLRLLPLRLAGLIRSLGNQTTATVLGRKS